MAHSHTHLYLVPNYETTKYDTENKKFVSVQKIAAHDAMLLLILASFVFSLMAKSEKKPHEMLFHQI